MLVILKKTLQGLWRIWCYTIMTITWICCFPLWLILAQKEEWYSGFYRVGRFWATICLYGCGFIPKKIIDKTNSSENHKKIFSKNEPHIYIANHNSIIDTLMLLYYVKTPCVFVGKKSLEKIPVFGILFKRVCVMVDRESADNRKNVVPQVKEKMKKGYGVCIFPEGGIPKTRELGQFKRGAFQISIETQKPIQPLVFINYRDHFSYDFLSGKPGILKTFILEKQNPLSQDTIESYSKRTEEIYKKTLLKF